MAGSGKTMATFFLAGHVTSKKLKTAFFSPNYYFIPTTSKKGGGGGLLHFF